MLHFAIWNFLLWATVSSQLEPLHTSSRWILDSNNNRFKLRCVNWAGHMEANIPEGLSHAPADSIARLISESGFNCVRLTYSIDMALNQNQKVSDSFATLGERAGTDQAAVDELWEGVKKNNPWIENANVIDAFAKVVDALGDNNVRVIMDNHVSRASWCCGNSDGNGWWDAAQGYNDASSRYFNTEEWLKGLEAIAKFAADHPAVAGMGLRNELRAGSGQDPNNHEDWYKFISQGAASVHNANKDLLIMMGGPSYATSLSFLYNKPLDRSPFGDKVVWEWHTYTMSPAWSSSGGDCEKFKENVGNSAGFLLIQDKEFTGPLWLSEFGFSMTGGPPEHMGVGSEDHYNYAKCLAGYLTSNDGDWALWALQGNYYVRNGVVDNDEAWGLLNTDWSQWRNPAVKELLGEMWNVTQGP